MDYNIYIHSTIDGEPNRNTQPWTGSESEPTVPWSAKAEAEDSSFKLMNPSGLAQKGVSSLKKAIPQIAIAFAVLKITDTVVRESAQIEATLYGDYRAQVEYNNFHNKLKWFFNPLGSAWAAAKAETSIWVEDRKRAQNRDLLGDSVINSYTGRGV